MTPDCWLPLALKCTFFATLTECDYHAVFHNAYAQVVNVTLFSGDNNI